MPTEPLDGATEPGPENSYPSTPGEFAARWNAWSDEERAEWLAASVENAATAMTCRVVHRRRRDDAARFATGGYIAPSSPPALNDGHGLRIVTDPDECIIRGYEVIAGRIVCGRASHPTRSSSCLAALLHACRSAGILGEDLDRAVAAYLAVGPVTLIDPPEALTKANASERAARLAATYGSDAARIAAIHIRSLPLQVTF